MSTSLNNSCIQSIEKTVSMTQQTLNEILKPIELCVQKTENGWRISTGYDDQAVMFLTDDVQENYAETFRHSIDGLDKILEMVGCARRWTFSLYSQMSGFKSFDNPYFGCKTLEEMLIKKDLLDDR